MAKNQLKSSNKDMKALLRACEKAGITIRSTGSGHYQLYLPNKEIMVISSTPRSNSTPKRMRARLIKAGVDLP